jgi:hypothetical protein
MADPKEPEDIDFRGRAQRHLETARRHIASLDGSRLVYAALELRMAIEAMAFDLFEAYLEEVSDDAMKSWQPRKVLEELATIDPFSKVSWTLSVETPEGEKVIGVEDRMEIKWAYDKHNALGSFLHEQTYAQIKKGREKNPDRLKEMCVEIGDRLQAIIGSELFRIKMDTFLSFACFCGHKIPVRTSTLQDQTAYKCKNCERWYDRANKSSTRVSLRQFGWQCANKHINVMAAHELKKGKRYRCKECGEMGEAYRLTFIVADALRNKAFDGNPPEHELRDLGEFIEPSISDDESIEIREFPAVPAETNGG